MGLRLSGINRFPVKSCRGEALQRVEVQPWGLASDRRWMVVDDDGAVLTARRYSSLLTVRPRLTGTGLRLSAPGAPDLDVATPRGDLVPVQVWSSELLAAPAGPAADAWFGERLGRPARLVYLDDPTRRRPNQDFARDTDRVSFADGYPLLLAHEASLDALNDLIVSGPGAAEGPLAMIRFRPNVVVRGGQPWAEDGWRRVRIGDAVFRAVKGCDRCVMTTIEPDTGVKGKEPIATLARHRRWNGKTWFGMNLIADTPGVVIAVGDDVEILDERPAPDGPPR